MIKVQRLAKIAAVEYPNIREFTRRLLVDRAPHHGYQHAIGTATLAGVIAKSASIVTPSTISLVRTVGILHDVADRKVDPSEYYRKRLDRMLSGIGRGFHYGVTEIISRVSLTREITVGTADWLPTLGPEGVLVRDYVSDADKLLSLGEVGYQRLVDYNRESYGQVYIWDNNHNRYGHTYLWHVNHVVEARIIKTPHYLRTEYARRVAPVLLDDLLCAHNRKLASETYVAYHWTV
jgi:hypothetical protein